MKSVYFWILTIVLLPAFARAETVVQTPVLSVSKDSPELKDLIGSHGSQLCAPISISQAVAFVGGAAPVRELFSSCGTDRETGTHYHAAQSCFTEALHKSGVASSAWIVGPHAVNAPDGVSLASYKHVVSKSDVLRAVKSGAAVVMAVGWYDEDANTHAWKRVGGHFVNVYGFSDENGAVTLRVANSLQDYSSRSVADSFDVVTAADADSSPSDTRVEIQGPGFQFRQKTFIEDLFEASASR